MTDGRPFKSLFFDGWDLLLAIADDAERPSPDAVATAARLALASLDRDAGVPAPPCGYSGRMDEFSIGYWARGITDRLGRIERKLDRLAGATLDIGEALMADLTALTADVTANTDATASAVALLNSIAQQLRDAATDPAAIEALASSIEQNTQSLAAAVTANTPAAPGDGTPVTPADGGAVDGGTPA